MVSCSDLRGFRELPRLAVLLVTLSILIYLGHMAGIGRCSVGYGSSLSPAFQGFWAKTVKFYALNLSR